ncbi:pectate lyase-domain-containing protein [Armillaria luteobubalina]|uniref:Probable pectate lyase F n=1 Tax=Armillaria luteobubalina TaxID=153913 RepID=A0AA39V4J5_9AGAR|nr:pectate lyase-domain-containing protein [Armillaria luteobubalina]
MSRRTTLSLLFNDKVSIEEEWAKSTTLIKTQTMAPSVNFRVGLTMVDTLIRDPAVTVFIIRKLIPSSKRDSAKVAGIRRGIVPMQRPMTDETINLFLNGVVDACIGIFLRAGRQGRLISSKISKLKSLSVLAEPLTQAPVPNIFRSSIASLADLSAACDAYTGGLPITTADIISSSAVIEVAAGETFDGGWKKGDRGSGASGVATFTLTCLIFSLREGATLQNIIIGANQAEGVYVGHLIHWVYITLKHIFLPEDAITIARTFVPVTFRATIHRGLHHDTQRNDEAGDYTNIIGGDAYHIEGKVIQHNSCSTVNTTESSISPMETAKASALVMYTSPASTPRMVEHLAGMKSNNGDIATIIDSCYHRLVLQWLSVFLEASPVLGEHPAFHASIKWLFITASTLTPGGRKVNLGLEISNRNISSRFSHVTGLAKAKKCSAIKTPFDFASVYGGAIAVVCIVCVAGDVKTGYSIEREEKFEEGRKAKRHDE